MNDAEFLRQLEDTTLPPAHFNHAGHVRAAYLYLNAAGDFPAALACISKSIRRYAASLGQPGRYHETMTVAYTAIIYQRMKSGAPHETWNDFATEHADLLDKQLLNRFFAPELLASDIARNAFVLPTRCGCESPPGFSQPPGD